MTPNEITQHIRDLANEARRGMDAHNAHVIEPLADAVTAAADLLEQQKRFLIELRNWKADA